MTYAKLKRMGDFVLALIGLIVVFPFCIVVAILIKLDSKGPVVFCQERMGKNQKPFTLYKFRTMSTTAPKDCPTCELKNSDAYITGLGKFFRKSSIDEIPQLLNILKGDMSFIGPRPVVLREQELIQARIEAGVYSVRPGVSGWAQINGRDAVTAEEKVKLDREYIEGMGLLFDIKCFVKTVIYVLKREGVVEGVQVAADSGKNLEAVPLMQRKAS